MLSRQEGSTTCHLASAQHWTDLAGGNTGRLFLTFGGPVRADRISYCPLDRVLTYKNLIYLLNLQFCSCDNFYPIALKGCRGIVFTHGVRMGGRVSGQAAGKSLSGLYLKNRKV